ARPTLLPTRRSSDLEGAGVAAPQGQEVGFHVEQPPVNVAPPRFAAAADQGVAAGFEADHRQRGAQVAEAGDGLAVQPPLPGLPAVAQAGLAVPAAASFLVPFGVDLQRRRVAGHQAVAHAAAEASAISEQVDGFQNAGLARAVVADQQVQARTGEDGNVGQAAQPPDLKPGQAHAGSANAQQNARSGPGVVVPRETNPDHSRSGITTWRQRSLEASRTSAEEFASRRAITTFSSRRALSASSR